MLNIANKMNETRFTPQTTGVAPTTSEPKTIVMATTPTTTSINNPTIVSTSGNSGVYNSG